MPIMDYGIFLIFLVSGLSVMPNVASGSSRSSQPVAVCQSTLDIVLLIDVSRSIIATNPGNRALLIDFLTKVVDQFAIGKDSIHVAAVLFREEATIIFYLNQFFTLKDVKDAIRNGITYFAGQTDIATALEITRVLVFSSFGGNRPYAPNVVLLLTDGEPSIRVDDTLKQAKLLKNNSTVITIGVNQNDLKILEDLATKDCFIKAKSFSSLHNMIDQVISMVCTSGSARDPTPIPVPITSTPSQIPTRVTKPSSPSRPPLPTRVTRVTKPTTESTTQADTTTTSSTTEATTITMATTTAAATTTLSTTMETTTISEATTTQNIVTSTDTSTQSPIPVTSATSTASSPDGSVTTSGPAVQQAFCTEHTYNINGRKGTRGGACLAYFFWKGRMYKTCTRADHHTYWCFINSRDWANCQLGPCKGDRPPQFCTEYTTNVMGKGENGGPCMFPFVWKGVMYHTCTNADYKTYWCYIDGHQIWAVCPPAPCKSTTASPICHDYTINVNGVSGTVGGPCLSLFYWDNIPYFRCTRTAHRTYWCFIDNKNWAECITTPCTTLAPLTRKPREKRDVQGYFELDSHKSSSSFSRANAAFSTVVLVLIFILL